MKNLHKLLVSFAIFVLLLAGCGEKEAPVPVPEKTPAEISEDAMENFVGKLHEGNYTVESSFLKTSVKSRDLVVFEYTEDQYTDYAVMSVNGESFQASIREDGLGSVSFAGENDALETSKTRLLNWWLDEEVSGGNMFELFYNQIEEPLTFLSHDERVKQLLLSMMGYGEQAIGYTDDVYMAMDDEDPKTVHFTAVVNDDVVGRHFYDDIDITVTLGDASGNEAAEAWMAEPVYPEARTAWNDVDNFILNSVFMADGEEAVPFPPFASYGLSIDADRFVMDDAAYIRDNHASEDDVVSYAELLKEKGYTEVEEEGEDGSMHTYYRKLLREAYKCYSSIEVAYKDGLDITAKKWYDSPKYNGLEEVNPVLKGFGYEELPASENFVNVRGRDTALALSESWLYFFDYATNTYVDIDFADKDSMQEYLNAYIETLGNADFRPHYVGGDEEEIEYYENENGFANFRYQFLDDDTVSLLFRQQRYIPAEDVSRRISEAGFPEIAFTEPLSAKDLTLFEKAQYGKDDKLFMTVSKTFETSEEAENFLNAYEEKLNAAGYERVNPSETGSLKSVVLLNEDGNMLVGVDFFEQSSGTMVNMDFEAK